MMQIISPIVSIVHIANVRDSKLHKTLAGYMIVQSRKWTGSRGVGIVFSIVIAGGAWGAEPESGTPSSQEPTPPSVVGHQIQPFLIVREILGRGEAPPEAGDDTPSNSGDSAETGWTPRFKPIYSHAIDKSACDTVLDFEQHPPLPSYTVDRRSDITISFDPCMKKRFAGEISIRARLLRSTPVELPVENYTRVSVDKLEQIQALSLPESSNFFREEEYHKNLVRSVITLSTRADSFLRSVVILEDILSPLPGLADLMGKDSLNQYEKKYPEIDLNSSEVVQNYIERFGEALKQLEGDRAELQTELLGFSDAIQGAFIDSNVALIADNKTFEETTTTAMRLIQDSRQYSDHYKNNYSDHQVALSQCSTLKGARQIGLCQVKAMRMFQHSLENQWQMATAVATLSAAPKAQKNSQSEPEAPKQNGRVPISPLNWLSQIKVMELALGKALAAEYSQRIRPARIQLAAVDIKHGEYIEVSVKSSTPRLKATGSRVSNDGGEQDEFVTTFRFRVVQEHISFEIGPQYVLVTRIGGTDQGSATSSPSIFKPTVGGALRFHLRTRNKMADYLIPSLDIMATLPDFNPKETFELGIGGGLGFLNEMLHFGGGINVSALHIGTGTETPYYFYIALDFLKTIDTFGILFGKASSGQP